MQRGDAVVIGELLHLAKESRSNAVTRMLRVNVGCHDLPAHHGKFGKARDVALDLGDSDDFQQPLVGMHTSLFRFNFIGASRGRGLSRFLYTQRSLYALLS